MSIGKLKKVSSNLRPAGDPLPSLSSWRKPEQSSAARGYGHRWRVERAAFLAAHPLCAMCAQSGTVAPASVVDHIEPHNGSESLFWNRENWQPLCAPCHNGRKQREDNASRYSTQGLTKR